MGLGLLGRGVGDTIFLAEHGAELIVTDLRDKETLAPSLAKLKKYKNIKYTLGRHNLEDFKNRDFIIKAAGVPLDSIYIAEARKNKIPVEMDASLFAKLVSDKFSSERSPSCVSGVSRGVKLMSKGALQQDSGQVTIVGVTGTRGKSTTTALIYELVKSFKLKVKSKNRVFKGGNLVAEATLPLIEKVKAGDIVVLELDSWQLQGFHDANLPAGEAGISPQVAVFTTFLDDHLIYYKGDTDRYFEDKTAIFKYQKNENILIAGKRVAELIGKSEVPVNGDFVVATKEDVPKDWAISIPGEHNLENIACAIKVAEYFKIPLKTVQKAVEKFEGVAGRLEYIRTVNGVKIYNDTNATTPDATIAGLRALRESRIEDKGIILIMGGTDKGLDMGKLVAEISKYCKGLVLLKESGTTKFLTLIHNSKFIIQKMLEAETLKECVTEAMKMAQSGDIVLFSPAFASFGKWFKNEYDRGEQFNKIVEGL
jgi:UDP-N-acetylmuramoylalanine--D-glutamate ligase